MVGSEEAFQEDDAEEDSGCPCGREGGGEKTGGEPVVAFKGVEAGDDEEDVEGFGIDAGEIEGVGAECKEKNRELGGCSGASAGEVAECEVRGEGEIDIGEEDAGCWCSESGEGLEYSNGEGVEGEECPLCLAVRMCMEGVAVLDDTHIPPTIPFWEELSERPGVAEDMHCGSDCIIRGIGGSCAGEGESRVSEPGCRLFSADHEWESWLIRSQTSPTPSSRESVLELIADGLVGWLIW